MTATYITAAEALARLRDDLASGEPPVRWPLGTGALGRIRFGPGAVLLLGGAPAVGKTALIGQLVCDALRLNADLRAVVGNVEMSPDALLERQLARVSGIPLTRLQERQLGPSDGDRLARGLATLGPLCDRLTFLRPPFSIANLADTADAADADLIVCDYVQRYDPPDGAADPRRAMGAVMSVLRTFAEAGCGVLVISALGRSKDARGRASYDEGLGLASFRETSELEYGADDAYILTRGDGDDERVLLHLKSRHGEQADVPLTFDGRLQRFTAADAGADGHASGGSAGVAARVAALWGGAATGDVVDGDEDDQDDGQDAE